MGRSAISWGGWSSILELLQEPLCAQDATGKTVWSNQAFAALPEESQVKPASLRLPVPSDPSLQLCFHSRPRQGFQAMLEALVEGSPVAIVANSPALIVTLWNPAAEALFGWKAEEVLGHSYPLVPESRRAQFEDLRARVGRGEGYIGIEDQRLHRDGSLIDVSMSTAPMRDANGAVIGFISIFEDITERLRLVERVRHSERLEALGRFVGGVAHDFNNSLTVILNTISLLRRNGPSNCKVTDLDAIESVGSRSAVLIQQLLAFSRRQVLRPGPVDLNRNVESLIPLVNRLIGERVSVGVQLGPEPLVVFADPSQLEQLVLNLAANARDAMPEGGRLLFATRARAPDLVELEVTDTGVGIPAEQLPHIFDPFFTTKPVGVGVGLGLASVYGAVKQSAGEITVESVVGRGTTFRILLRRWQGEWQPPVNPSPAPPHRCEPQEGSGRAVLLVEDDSLVRGICASVLQPLGFEVIQAANGLEAMAVLESEQVLSLMMTDVVMPGLGGRALAEKCQGLRPALPILLVSGHPNDIDAFRDLPSNVAFLSKPFSIDELEAAIASLLPPGSETATLGGRS